MSLDAIALGRLLQLSSASLPIGAFAYSEGIEYLVSADVMRNPDALFHWVKDDLCHGPIRTDAAIVQRIFVAREATDLAQQSYWDAWVSANRETEELREQSKTMGRALWRIAQGLGDAPLTEAPPTNFLAVYAVVTAQWRLPLYEVIYAYLHSWLTNLVTAGVKLIPIGQMSGQQVLWRMQNILATTTEYAMTVPDDDLYSWSAGLSLASMRHESQYSRLFRS